MFHLAVVFVKNMRLSGNPEKWLTQQHEPLGTADAYGGISWSKSGKECYFTEHDQPRGRTAPRGSHHGADTPVKDAKVAENVLRAMWSCHLTGESNRDVLQLLQNTLAATIDRLAQENVAFA